MIILYYYDNLELTNSYLQGTPVRRPVKVPHVCTVTICIKAVLPRIGHAYQHMIPGRDTGGTSHHLPFFERLFHSSIDD